MGGPPKIGGKNPNHPFGNRVWNHDFHHPFRGTPIFGNTHIATENGWLEDDPFLLGPFRPIFRGHVSFRECI